LKVITYIMAGFTGLIFVAAVFLLPVRLYESSVGGEAAMLARNINDAARQVGGVPNTASAEVEFQLPENLGDQEYVLLFWEGSIWISVEDGRLWNYSTPVADSIKVFQGGNTITLSTTSGVVVPS